MDLSPYKNLFSQINWINSRYKKISDLTGENFNVFRILKLEADEVRMHSAFLAELLNPKGSHGQRDSFLRLFVQQVCFKGQEIDPLHCKVEVEKNLGLKVKEANTGGRIDIVVTDTKGRHQLIIENKIYAGDQDDQLLRYHTYNPGADLFYLTLDGKAPAEKSSRGLEHQVHYKCLSYKTDIVTWLEQCRKEAATQPILRESITQYINLIKYLTNQTLNDSMNDEITNLLSANLEASFTIANNLEQVKRKLIADLETQLQPFIAKYGFGYLVNINFEKNYTGLYFWKEEWRHLNIGVQFWDYDQSLVCGVVCREDPGSVPEALRAQIRDLPNKLLRSNTWWPMYDKIDENYGNWAHYGAWELIASGSMAKYLEEKIELVLNLVKGTRL